MLEKPHTADSQTNYYHWSTNEIREQSESNTRNSPKTLKDKQSTRCSVWPSSKTIPANRKLIVKTDACCSSAGYALVTRDSPQHKRQAQLQKKSFAPMVFGSRVFTLEQLKMSIYSIYCKEILAFYHAFLEYCHILWERKKTALIFLDKSVTRNLLTKAIPSVL